MATHILEYLPSMWRPQMVSSSILLGLNPSLQSLMLDTGFSTLFALWLQIYFAQNCHFSLCLSFRYTPNTPNVAVSDFYGTQCVIEGLCNRSFYPVDNNGDVTGPAVSTALYQHKQRPFWTSTVARFNANAKLGLPASASQNWYSDFGC